MLSNRTDGRRLIEILQMAIRLSRKTYVDIERELGWSAGTITRLFRGGLHLKIHHLLSILQVIQFSPARLFAVAFPYERGSDASQDRLQRFLEDMFCEPEELKAKEPGPARDRGDRLSVPAASPLAQEDVDERVKVALARLLGSAALAGSEAKPAKSEAPEPVAGADDKRTAARGGKR